MLILCPLRPIPLALTATVLFAPVRVVFPVADLSDLDLSDSVCCRTDDKSNLLANGFWSVEMTVLGKRLPPRTLLIPESSDPMAVLVPKSPLANKDEIEDDGGGRMSRLVSSSDKGTPKMDPEMRGDSRPRRLSDGKAAPPPLPPN